MLPIEQTWLILVDLLTTLKKSGVDIPNSINKEISLLKTSINSYKKDKSHSAMIKEFDHANVTITEVQDKLLEYVKNIDTESYKKNGLTS